MAIQTGAATAGSATDATTSAASGKQKEIAMSFVVDSCTPSLEALGEKYILPMVRAAMQSSPIKVGVRMCTIISYN
jgi:hypothetical protein